MRQCLNIDIRHHRSPIIISFTWAILALIAGGLLGGCATFSTIYGSYPAGTIIVNTAPQGALLTFDDKTQCTTPCAVPVLKELSVKVAKAGYRAGTFLIRPTIRRQVTIPMTLSAPTVEVEETSLQDL